MGVPRALVARVSLSMATCPRPSLSFPPATLLRLGPSDDGYGTTRVPPSALLKR